MANKYSPISKYAPIRNHRLYGVWNNMQGRCTKPNHPFYARYGERGIKIEWKTFTDFADDMLPSFKEGLTLDRIDNDGNYGKENCRWATRREQANNTRRNKFFLYEGQNLTLPEHARRFGLKPNTVKERIRVYKWTLEKSLLTPTRKRG